MITTTCWILWIPTSGVDARTWAVRASAATTAASAAARTTRVTQTNLGERGDDDLTLARPVELAEEDPLPAAERELPVAERDEDLRARQRRAHVRRRVRTVGILHVLPVPAVVDDLLQRVLEILRDERVGVLVDRDAGRRVRDVDERGRGAVRLAERLLHLRRDVDELGLAFGLEVDLLHAVILGRPCRRRSTNGSWTPFEPTRTGSSPSSTRRPTSTLPGSSRRTTSSRSTSATRSSPTSTPPSTSAPP